jgi:hypothetical protein
MVAAPTLRGVPDAETAPGSAAGESSLPGGPAGPPRHPDDDSPDVISCGPSP